MRRRRSGGVCLEQWAVVCGQPGIAGLVFVGGSHSGDE